MKTANVSRSRGQVYSVGNYLMTGKVLGKGHFARVEEATHRIIGKKVAIKIIDLTCIKEEYARRNLHREPRVMAKLRHPCIAALYETMMHGPRLYVVMEAAGGGDLCGHVLGARGPARGLPEARARPLAAQLVSAVRHMHARGVVHRDLKMENIMLDSTKQFIKIVDFGLSNVWSAGGGLRTPCGSLEYAAPELFVDGRRYGPEVDLWSIGVIVYGMVTGGLPFAGAGAAGAGAGAGAADGAEGRSRPQLRAAIARGFSRKQRAALACVSNECKAFVQQLLEPNVELRMKIEEAARHRWLRRPGLRMKAHPFGAPEPKLNREIYRQIAELGGQSVTDVVAQIKADPFGAVAGMYNIKTHVAQLASAGAGGELLWGAAGEPRPASPPDYRRPDSAPPRPRPAPPAPRAPQAPRAPPVPAAPTVPTPARAAPPPSPRFSLLHRPPPAPAPARGASGASRGYDGGDCRPEPRLASIDELSDDSGRCAQRARAPRAAAPAAAYARGPKAAAGAGAGAGAEAERRLSSCPTRFGEARRSEFYRRAGDGLPSWRAAAAAASPAPRILLQTNATTIKRASLGNIVSPHSSSNSHCKSERALPVSWRRGAPAGR